MYEFSVPMALVDFIPVILFAFTGVLLMRNLYFKMEKYGFAMLAAGTINVFSAGFLKALWKLLYALNICNFEALNKLFLPLQSIGFLLAGVSLVILLCRKKSVLYAVAPPVFSGTAVFLSMMVLGLGCMCVCLGIIAAKKKKILATVLFILSFIASMGMGYAGRLDSTAAWVNWLEQGINVFSQACLLGGMVILHKVENGEKANG